MEGYFDWYDATEGNDDINALTPEGNTALHSILSEPICLGPRSRELLNIEHIIEILLDEGIDVNALNYRSETALYLACKLGLERIADMLLEKNADVNVQETENGYTALHWASAQMSQKMMSDLLDRGAKINVSSHNGLTPLLAACDEQNINGVKLLLFLGAEVNCTMEGGLTPLHLAVMHSNTSMIMYLLTSGADPYINSETNCSPIWLSCNRAQKTGDFESFKTFVEHAKIDVNFKHAKNNTMLHYACAQQDIHNINKLLELGASVGCWNEAGLTPMEYLDLTMSEIQSMKEIAIDRYTTLFHLFTNIDKMAWYVDKNELKEAIEANEFPELGEIFKAHLKRARLRRELLEKARPWMSQLTGFPECIVDKILGNYSEEELIDFAQGVIYDFWYNLCKYHF